MKPIKKAVLLSLRNLAYRWRILGLYYWADLKVYELRAVYVMPMFYYRRLYITCVWLAQMRKFRTLADRMIHSIPFHIRFELAG
jgi:hypothetical protein